MNRRIDLPSALVLAGAALLLISLFVSWFADSNAFEAFEALDLVLLGIAGAAAAAGLGRLTRDPDDLRPALALGLATIVIVGLQVVEPPPGFGDDETEAGVWLALVAGFLIAAGAAMALASINVTVDVQARERRRRVAAVDRREQPAGASSVRAAAVDARPGKAADAVVADDELHDADSLFAERAPKADLPTPDDVDRDDDRTQPMRPLPPDEHP